MEIQNFKPYIGQHCETTATGCLLKNIGIELSEPLLFGLGEGLSYIFWNMKGMDFPFMGGRIKPDELTENICRNLNLELEVKETSSIKKAWKNLEEELGEGKVIGLKLDAYYLDYFEIKFHFAGHYAAMYGYNDENAFLVDTEKLGTTVETSLNSLVLARNAKGPMSSRNRMYSISGELNVENVPASLRSAIRNNCDQYLNPLISNISYKGINKTAKEIFTWFHASKNIKSDFTAQAKMIEGAGTGGALFRNLYRDFLEESNDILQLEEIERAWKKFVEIAGLWSSVAELFKKTGEELCLETLEQASEILKLISLKEKLAFETLSQI